MHITLCDSRSLVVALVQPANDKLWNWATSAWEAGPFNPATHCRALAPAEAAPSPLAALQSADIGYELLSRPDAAAAVFAVSGTGTAPTYTLVDVWPYPASPANCTGGFTRL